MRALPQHVYSLILDVVQQTNLELNRIQHKQHTNFKRFVHTFASPNIFLWRIGTRPARSMIRCRSHATQTTAQNKQQHYTSIFWIALLNTYIHVLFVASWLARRHFGLFIIGPCAVYRVIVFASDATIKVYLSIQLDLWRATDDGRRDDYFQRRHYTAEKEAEKKSGW